MFDKPDSTEQRKSSRPPTQRRYRFAFGLSRRKQKTMMTIIAVAVTFTFVIGFHQLFMGIPDDDVLGGKKIGTLVGEPLTDAQLNRAMVMARIHLLLSMGASEDSIDQFNKAVRKTGWRWIASLRYAAKLGITATKEEAFQAELDQFKRDNVFLAEEYDYFIKKRLPEKHISLADFRLYMQNSLVLSKLRNIMSTAAWLPPFDMQREIARFTDTFMIESVEIPRSSLDTPVTVSEQDARSFYENNPRYFTQPDRMRVTYTVFPASNYMAAVAEQAESRAKEHYESYKSEFESESNGVKTVRTFAEVKDSLMSRLQLDAATNYYVEHMQDYTTTDTNYLDVAKPFADVKDSILKLLARKEALGIAEEKATEFVDTMNPGRAAKLVPMERAAAATNLVVYTSAYFGRYESVPGLDVSFAFNRHAFENLRAGDPYDHFSTPIVEKSGVYVISYHDKIDSHLSDFTAASNTAYELARNDKIAKALTAKATGIRNTLQAELKAKKKFQDAARSLNLTPVAGGPFSYLSQPTNIPISALALCGDQELTEPIPGTNGVTIAYVVSRTDGMMSTDPSFMQSLAESIRNRKADSTFIEWQQRLIENEQAFKDDKELEEDDDATNTLKSVKSTPVPKEKPTPEGAKKP